MNIKNDIKIGSMSYNVKITNEPIILDHQECKGIIEYDDLVIKISNKIAKQRQEETFIHEILHGIIRERNLEIEDEEILVDEISKGLYQFINDNIDIFR
ncbi:phage protein [[Clostridium] sordellii]|uniref:hypothetical protein n=1 Tax=Paraclostridium sordellii TaxID=1505 RepID=UPI00030FF46A|nr:hypothetical protein [Paeniclostridium sordellii]TAN63768.1 hypothetical protein WS9_015440 [Paeniclostridium sordellii 8483]CEQ10678.1 phage protein [[Clostridium] sordellii] [Paeniclostridium sordellii]